MYGQDLTESLDFRALLIPAAVCAVLSVIIKQGGFLSFLFLIPLGYAAVVYQAAAAWAASILALLLNGICALVFSLYYRSGAAAAALDTLYFTVTVLGFTWIMAGGGPRSRTVYRFSAASAAAALVFLLIFFGGAARPGLAAVIRSQAELLTSMYIASSGGDAVKRSFLENALTPEQVIQALQTIALRGGALASAFFVFFASRQVSLGAAWIIKRRRPVRGLSGFHVPANAVWVLSLSLAAILLSRLMGADIPEIIAWNVLILCGILFLAQGIGIALFVLTRRPLPPVLRLLTNVLIIGVILSPGINTIVLAALVLLGIAENWLPLRAPKHDGPASTPGL